MKKNNLFICFLAVFFLSLSSCQSDKKESNGLTISESKEVSEYTRTYPFSSLTAKDQFIVKLSGEKPEDMLLDFSIKNEQDEIIYTVQVKGTDLLGSTDPNVDLRLEKDQISFIKNIAKDFLNDDQFLEPAVMPDQEADDYSPDKNFYEELKKSGFNGFMYRLGKENKYYIAFSKAENKVKVYYNCC